MACLRGIYPNGGVIGDYLIHCQKSQRVYHSSHTNPQKFRVSTKIMMAEAVSRKLKLYLPPSVVSGVTIDHQSELRFRVSLEVSNITKCRLEIRSDPNIFHDSSQEIEVFFPAPIGRQHVDITLTPLRSTTAPVWINITAKADASSAQACGFFASVV
jgi:hypothetical protein